MTNQQRKKVELTKFKYDLNDSSMQKIIMENLKDIMEKERFKITKTVVDAMISIFVICLHDDHTFGKKRLDKLLSHVQNQFECYDKGLVKLEELDQEAKKYYTPEKIFKN